MRTFFFVLVALVRALVLPRSALAMEDAALRQQLGAYLRTGKRPRLHPGDRVFSVILRRV